MSINPELFKSKKTLIPYFTYADPSPEITEKIVEAAFDSGASVVELGIPFSESLADGPVIQTSHFRALQNNSVQFIQSALQMVQRISENRQDRPIVFMSAYNLIFQYGLESFFRDAKRNSLAGLIVPDLPFDRSKELRALAEKYEIDLIFLVTPQSDDARIQRISEWSSGFVYVVSTTGITGEQTSLATHLPDFVSKVKHFSSIPVAVGFGISTSEHVAEVSRYADGAIVGSALVKLFETPYESDLVLIERIKDYIRDLLD